MQLSSLQTQIRVSNQTLFNVFFIRSHCMVYHVTERRRTFLSPVCDGLLWSPACCSSAEAEVQAWEMCWGERFGEAGLPAPPWADPAPRLHLSGFRFWKRETRWALSGAAAVLTGPNLTSAFGLLLVSSGSSTSESTSERRRWIYWLKTCVGVRTITETWSQITWFVPVVPTGARMPARYLQTPGHPSAATPALTLLVFLTGWLRRPAGVWGRRQVLSVWSCQLGRRLRTRVPTGSLHQSQPLQHMDRREDGSVLHHCRNPVSSEITLSSDNNQLLFSNAFSMNKSKTDLGDELITCKTGSRFVWFHLERLSFFWPVFLVQPNGESGFTSSTSQTGINSLISAMRLS